MKVKIEIDANIMLLGVGEPDSKEFYDECYYDFFILGSITVYANGENITKKKGKYVIVENMITDWIKEKYDTPALVKQLTDNAKIHTEVEIDVDEFDPKKLQLRKSTYELEEVPYAIDGHHILYDGELIELEVMYDYRYSIDDIYEDLSFVIE